MRKDPSQGRYCMLEPRSCKPAFADQHRHGCRCSRCRAHGCCCARCKNKILESSIPRPRSSTQSCSSDCWSSTTEPLCFSVRVMALHEPWYESDTALQRCMDSYHCHSTSTTRSARGFADYTLGRYLDHHNTKASTLVRASKSSKRKRDCDVYELNDMIEVGTIRMENLADERYEYKRDCERDLQSLTHALDKHTNAILQACVVFFYTQHWCPPPPPPPPPPANIHG